MRDKYDIIVIGAGVGGLVSAALLSKLGKKILIIEKEPKPGGYLNEFKRDEFTFDVSLHLLNGCNSGGYTAELFRKCGIADDIKFLKPKYLYRSVFPDFDVRIPHNLAEHNDILAKLFPKSRNELESLMAVMSKIFLEVNNQSPSKRISASMLPYLKNSYEKVLSEHITDVKLKAILSQLWMYFGSTPSSVRAIDFCYPYFDYVINGGCYPEGGSYVIAKALVKRIKEQGGDILLNKRADKILVDKGTCRGVQCGDSAFLCDTVISNVDLRATAFEMIGRDKWAQACAKKINTVEPSISAVEIFLGLSRDLKTAYPDDYEIFVNNNYDADEQYKDSLRNKADRAPFAIGLYSNIDRFAAAEGESAVTIIMLSGYDYWKAKTKEEYKEKKEEVADILINRAAKIVPEIKKYIKKKIVATPLTFERYTSNSKGAIYGYAQTASGKREVRPNELKDIKNLYFSSAWARQGSGIVKVLRSAEEVFSKISNEAR